MFVNNGWYSSSVKRTNCGRCEGVVKGSCIRIYQRGSSTRSYHILCALLDFREKKTEVIKLADTALKEIYEIAHKHDHNTKRKAF